DQVRGRWKSNVADLYLKTLASSYMPDRETAMEVEMAGGQVIHMCRRPVPEIGYVSTYTDITAQLKAGRRAEQALKLLEAVMDAVPAVLHVKDRDLRYRMVNRRFLEISGLRRNDIIGKTIGETFAPERLEGDCDPDAALLRTAKPVPFHETKIRLYGPQPWDALSTKVPLLDERGEVSHIVTVELDISERKKAEAALRESEELYRLLVDIAPYGIMLHDSTGIVFLNRAGCRMLDVANSLEVIGRHYLDFVVPAERGEAARRVAEALEEGHELPSLERRLVTQEGREIDVAIVAVPFQRGGTPLALVMFRDISESKRMERALRESERHFRSLVESHPLPVWVVDFASGDILYESPASAALFGRAAPSKGSSNVTVHWPDPEDREDFLRQLEAEGELRDYEWRARKENGSLFWVMVRARRIRQDNRDLIVSSMFDLTERKQREAEMREARETLEDAIESLSEGFALFDQCDRLVICNTRYREFHSKSRDLVVAGMTWAGFITAAAERAEFKLGGKTVAAWVQSMLAQRRAGIRNLEIQHTDGCWYQISHQRTRRGGTAVIRTEITHLKTMEQALRESEERFRSIANAHPVPVIICTIGEGEVLYASPAAASLWGGPGGELIGRRVTEFYADPRDREKFLVAFRRHGHLDSYQLRLKRSDGREFPAAIAARPIVYDGRHAIVSGIFDLTEQKTAEAEIAKQREALHQSEKLNALGSLLAGVAHELNNPLSVVVGRSIMLESADIDPRIATSVTKIRLAAERCARIVKTFLAMARQQAPSRVPVRLADVIEASLDMVGYRLRSAGIQVICDIAPDLPETMADPDQLNQMFSNLFLNAQQAMAENDAANARILRILAHYDGAAHCLEIGVIDTGPGIAADVMPRVFEPFFTTKPAGVGTGIGLAVTRGIIQSHGGSISVRSPWRDGGGAAFCISLPVQPVERRPGSVGKTGAARAASTRRILIVDDETDIARMLAEILIADGHSVAVAESGEQALQTLETAPFDLVISDLIMPGMDGPRLYKHLQEHRPELANRILFMTGDTLSMRARAFVTDTARPVLEKPFTPEEARRTVHEALGRRLAC
ncbi:MAG: PAS domain S-box protein, partial [Hyphomicrobium sp.]